MRSRLGAFATAVSAVLSTGIGLASPADAATVSPDGRINASCGDKISAFDTSQNHVLYDKYIGAGLAIAPHTHIHLSDGYNDYHGWVVFARVTRAPSGTKVWMDWSDDYGANWHQCGPYKVDGSQGAHDRWTWAVRYLTFREARACGQVPGGPVVCTPWK